VPLPPTGPGSPLGGGDPFAALADPTRRHILELLVRDGPTTATALAGELDISRQAVARHLQLLAGAGVARFERIGRETRFEARLDGFDRVRDWIARVEHGWTDRLSRLAASLEEAGPGEPPT
jgi:predicted ArsR family transcriptional regulator